MSKRYSRFYLKQSVRQEILFRGIRVFAVTLAFFGLVYVFQFLIRGISGYTDYYTRVLDKYVVLYEQAIKGTGFIDPEALYDVFYNTRWVMPDTAGWMLIAVCALMVVVVRGVYLRYCMIVSRGHKATFQNIKEAFNFIVKILLIRLMQTVIIGACSLLFVVPGIIMLYKFRLAMFIMFDNPELSALACMKESARLMKERKAELFKLDLSFFGWYFLHWSMMIMGVSFVQLWTMPFTRITWARYYDIVLADGTVDDVGRPYYDFSAEETDSQQ